MKKLASAVALSAFAFVASPALAGEAMQLSDAQMDGVTAAGFGDTDIRVPIIRNNVASHAGVITQNSGDNSLNTNGGVFVTR